MFVLLLLLFFFAVAVAILRFWRLGDLSPNRKFIEALIWFLGTYVAGLGGIKVLQALLLPSGEMPMSSHDVMQEARALRPEQLTSLESELPEMDRPEATGLTGRPPEELAEALRKLSESDNR